MPEIPFAWDANQLSVVVLALALALTWFSLIRSQRRKSATPPTQATQEGHGAAVAIREPTAGHAVHPATISEWEVRMHELARDLEGRITSKLGLLENLVREADRAAARLEAALRAAEQVRRIQAARVLEPVSPVKPGESAEPAGEARSENIAQPAPASEAVLSETGHPATPLSRSAVTPRSSHVHEEIYTLADYGYEPEEIACRTNLPIGEVQLILSLRRTRQNREPPTPSG